MIMEKRIKYNRKEVERVNFAVCDFNSKDSLRLKNDLSGLWPDVEIDLFHDCGRLAEQIRNGAKYDLLFLDVFVLYMKLPDGSGAIDMIRQRLPRSEVVFTSTRRDYGQEAFEHNALYYFSKPYSQEQLLEVRRRLHARHMPGVEVYDCEIRQERRILYERIVYVESVKNYLHIHLTDGTFVNMRGSLTDFMEELDGRFLKINRGIIANMDAVEQMKADSCKVSGLTFMLSRNRKAELRKQYYEYILDPYVGGGVI